MNTNKILILDIETTGFSSTKNKIVEIGIVDLDIETGEKNIIFDMVFNPQIPEEEIESAWIVEKGYMTTEEILNGADIREHLLEIQEIIDSYPNGSTAFNNSFDFRFLESVGFFFQNKLECPMILSTPICKLPNKNGRNGYKWPSVEKGDRHLRLGASPLFQRKWGTGTSRPS